MTIRVEAFGNGDIHQAMSCGEACSAMINVTSTLKNLPINDWQDISLPVACFVEKGLDPTSVETPFALVASEGWALSIHRAELVSSNEPTNCP